MDEKKEYYKIITTLWKMFRNDIEAVAAIKTADDPEWKEICDRYEKVASDAPKPVRGYAGDMVLVHVAELEKKWRYRTWT